MKVNRDAKIRPGGFSDSGHSCHNGLYFAKGIDIVHFLGCIHFNGCKSARYAFLGRLANISWTIAANPGIDTHFLPDRAPKKLVDWKLIQLPLEIPERLVNPGDCAHQDRPATVEPGAIQDL